MIVEFQSEVAPSVSEQTVEYRFVQDADLAHVGGGTDGTCHF